ncbi:autotransporter outer membrane beta-barrel domain-containing protein [Sutterella wadsworthensis]|uniref:autotransporter outer membrane beta-barrel domain-containing protein n=1 Tax=Sutterella wadsworthensis TaxID=40545 RepID=UPI002430B923|nr:autotransporter outer membrane beta-barrel domain-containing protein [Sutterella wadsworthensis]
MTFKYTNLPPPPSKYAFSLLTIAILSTSSIAFGATKIEWVGTASESGDSQITRNFKNGEYDGKEISGIKISLEGYVNNLWGDTTEGLVISGKNLTVQGNDKNVTIVNVSQNDKIDNNGGIYATNARFTPSSINFNNLKNVYIAAIGGKETGNDSTAISSKGMGNKVSVSGDTVRLIGSLDVTGLGNQIEVSMSGKDSFWYGSKCGGSLSEVAISLANQATWIFNASGSKYNQNGQLDNLSLDGGIVVIADEIVWQTYENTIIKDSTGNEYVLSDYRNRDGKYSEVDISNLTGPGGIFKIDLDWQTNQGAKQYTEKSDFIKIGKAEDNSSQTVWFDISKAHLDEMKDGDKLYFASVGSGDTTFSTNADGEVSSADEIYSFKYSSQSEESDNLTYWFLTKSQGGTNENVALLRNAALASYSLASDLDRFHERQGEARHEERGTNGLWARYRYSDIGRKHAFDMDKNMIQVGYNKEVSTADSHKIVSLAFDYTRADTDLFGVSGSGSSDRYGLNLYYTVLGESGSYADFNAKIGRLGSDYNLRNDSGQKIGGSLWQTFYGVSAELGWKFELNDFLFIEPQTQLQVIRIEGTRFETESGIKAQIADTNSIIGRVGFRAGSSFSFGSAERISTAYIYGDVLREFKGDHVFAARGHSTSVDFSYADKETWYDAGIGANLSLSSNTDLWLNAKYIFGGYFESSRQINAGVRFSF